MLGCLSLTISGLQMRNILQNKEPVQFKNISIVKDKDGKVIRSVKDVKMGDSLTIKLNDGTLKAKSDGEEL